MQSPNMKMGDLTCFNEIHKQTTPITSRVQKSHNITEIPLLFTFQLDSSRKNTKVYDV